MDIGPQIAKKRTKTHQQNVPCVPVTIRLTIKAVKFIKRSWLEGIGPDLLPDLQIIILKVSLP
jgi:hypothetical protein